MTFRPTGTSQVDINRDGIPEQLTRTYTDSAHPDRKITLNIDAEGHVRLSYPTQVVEGARNHRHTVTVETRREALQILMNELQQRRAALTRAAGHGEIPDAQRPALQRDATICQNLLDHIDSLQRELTSSDSRVHLPRETTQRIAQFNSDRNFQRVHNRIFGADHFNDIPHDNLTALQTRTMTPEQRQITVAAIKDQIGEQLHTAEMELSYFRHANPQSTPASLRANLERARDAFNRAVHAQRELEHREPSAGHDTFRTGQFASLQQRLEEGAIQLYPTPSPTQRHPQPTAPAQQRTFLASIQGAPGVSRLTAVHRRSEIGQLRNTFEIAVGQASSGHLTQARTTLAQATRDFRTLRQSANRQHPQDRQILAGLMRAHARADRTIRFQRLVAQAGRTRNPEQATRLFARANALLDRYSAGDTAREPLALALTTAHGDFLRAHPMPDVNPRHPAPPPRAVARRDPPTPREPARPTEGPAANPMARRPLAPSRLTAADRAIPLFNPAAPVAGILRNARASLTQGDRATAEALLAAARTEMNALPAGQRSTLPRQIAALETRIQNAQATEQFNGLLAQARNATDSSTANGLFDQANRTLTGIHGSETYVAGLRHRVATARRDWATQHAPAPEAPVAQPDNRQEIALATRDFTTSITTARNSLTTRHPDQAQAALTRAEAALERLSRFGEDVQARTAQVSQLRGRTLGQYERRFNVALDHINATNAGNARSIITDHIAPLLIALGRGGEVDRYTQRLTEAAPMQGVDADNAAVAARPSAPPPPETAPTPPPTGRGVIPEAPGASVAVAPPIQPANTITVPPNADPVQVVAFVERNLVYQAERAQNSGNPERALAYANAAREVLSHLRWPNPQERGRLTTPLFTRLQQVNGRIPQGTQVAQVQLPQLPASVVRPAPEAPTMVARAPEAAPPAPTPAPTPGEEPATEVVLPRTTVVAQAPAGQAPGVVVAQAPTPPLGPQPVIRSRPSTGQAPSIDDLLARVGNGTPARPLTPAEARALELLDRVGTRTPAQNAPVVPAGVVVPTAARPGETPRPITPPVVGSQPAQPPPPSAPPVRPAPPPPAPEPAPQPAPPPSQPPAEDILGDLDSDAIGASTDTETREAARQEAEQTAANIRRLTPLVQPNSPAAQRDHSFVTNTSLPSSIRAELRTISTKTHDAAVALLRAYRATDPGVRAAAFAEAEQLYSEAESLRRDGFNRTRDDGHGTQIPLPPAQHAAFDNIAGAWRSALSTRFPHVATGSFRQGGGVTPPPAPTPPSPPPTEPSPAPLAAGVRVTDPAPTAALPPAIRSFPNIGATGEPAHSEGAAESLLRTNLNRTLGRTGASHWTVEVTYTSANQATVRLTEVDHGAGRNRALHERNVGTALGRNVANIVPPLVDQPHYPITVRVSSNEPVAEAPAPAPLPPSQPVQPAAVAVAPPPPPPPPPPTTGRRVRAGEELHVTGRAPAAGPAPLPTLRFGMTIPNFRTQAFPSNSYARAGISGTVANLVSTLYRRTARSLPANSEALPEMSFTFRVHYSADGHTANVRVSGRLEELPASVRPQLERDLRSSIMRGLPALAAGEYRVFDVTVNVRP